MASLRDQQKAYRDRRILDAAVALFRGRGFRAARLEDIAAKAGVSVGTLYNYYRTKGDLLMAVVALEVEEVLAGGTGTVADPPGDVEAALRALIHGYYDHSQTYLTKPMWRSAMALSIEAPDTPQGARYAALDARLARQVGALIATLQARGQVRAGLDAAGLGDAVFGILNQLFIAFVRDDAMTLDALKGALSRQLRPLAHMIQTEDS